MLRVFISLPILLSLACPVHGQELASSFDQLRVLVKAGDTLAVTDAGGRQRRGQLLTLAGTSLDLVVDGVSHTLTQDRLATVRLRHQDTLANGAKIGFGVGAGFGLLAGLAVVSEFGAPAVAGIVAVYGAMGTGIGVGVDALRTSERIIYSRPLLHSAPIRAAPIVDGARHGIGVTVTF